MRHLLSVFDRAVEEYSGEIERLRFLPDNRYNTSLFPTIGQYDWLSGVVLYCVVRHLRPTRIVEISTSSGYSSLFSALALRANGFGRLEGFELQPEVASAAQRNFQRFGVDKVVTLHVGDARLTTEPLLQERRVGQELEILFLDSEHTGEFARFYLDSFLPDTHPESLFHMHDILPPDGKFTYRPIEAIDKSGFRLRSHVHSFMSKHVRGWTPMDVRRWVRAVGFDPSSSSEARLGHRLAATMPLESHLYAHDLRGRYPAIQDARYDCTSVWRCDANGRPMEWNESWWAVAGPLRQACFKAETFELTKSTL